MGRGTVSIAKEPCGGGKFIERTARAAYASARIYEHANFVKIEFAKREFVKFANEAECQLVRARRVLPAQACKAGAQIYKKEF
jgi:hypothetical protein